ncbi:helicase-related protein [Jonesiaceae bacterium BS-20]|uniref:Helicase-related protein n=1 Tax=Jonesiaceae bacterium BS-20 TaxID=3120821 RepID=A0AAU7DY19_9MICO
MNATAKAALNALTTLSTLAGPLTTEQRTALTQWSGWGPIAPALHINPKPEWEATADQLTQLFETNPTWVQSAAEAPDTSFYTPTWLVEAMAAILTSVGYTGGNILEPGCGNGRFLGVNLPNTQFTGIEQDSVSAAMASALHPEATVINKPLQKTALREGTFDAVLANVPFSAHAPFDPACESASLHQYFLLRALKALRPGGYLIALTSRALFDGTQMDALAEEGDLHAVVRLASGTFVGTSAVADLIVIQKRAQGTEPAGWNDRAERGEISYSYLSHSARYNRLRVVHPEHQWRSAEVNIYFDRYPQHVAGTMSATGFDQAPITVTASDPQQAGLAAIAAATAHLPALPARPASTGNPFEDVTLADQLGRKEGAYHLDGDKVVRIIDGAPQPVARAGKELKALIRLRDLATTLIAKDALHATELASAPDQHHDLRTTVRAAYETYVNQFGYLGRGHLIEGAVDAESGEPKWSWRRPTLGGFRKDPDWMIVAALEVYNPDTQQGKPAAMLSHPVNRRPQPITRAQTPAQALAVSLGETGNIDLARIAGLLNLPNTAAARTALDTLVFKDPVTSELVPAAQYLSGNVRTKLEQAQAALQHDPTQHVNVAALTEVVPADYGPLQIHVSLGAPWVSPQVVMDFISEVLNTRATVTYTPGVAVWEVNDSWYDRKTEASLLYGTSERNPLQLLDAALNARTVIIYDEVYDPSSRAYKKVRDNAATLAAASKIDALQERFSIWVWEGKDCSAQLVRQFNDQFRSHVPRKFDGSTALLPTLAPDVHLWPWQKSVIERIVSSPRTMCNHQVGRGKTLSMIGAAVTLRQLGLATKPLIAVPSHLLEQIATEALQAFPSASVLVATKEDLTKENRKLFAARCATGDWDAVVMTHEALGSIPVDTQVEQAWIADQKHALISTIQSNDALSARGRGAKAIASALKRFDTRTQSLRAGMGADDIVTFEQLGVDFLAVDEVHMFRRLPTGGRGSGFSFGSSKRATDLLLKVHSLGLRRPGKPHFAGFTGTPWSNTLAETYVWQQFFQPDRLTASGIHTFGEWASMFVKFVTAVEVAPDGSGFRVHTRPAEVTNARVLMDMFTEIADFIDPNETHAFVIPNANRKTNVVDPSPAQKEYVNNLVVRADRVRGSNSSDDNMLAICGDGRRVALDPQLVGIQEPSPKVNAVAANVAAVHHKYADVTIEGATSPGVLQLVVCDQGTPGDKGAQTYGRIKAALIARGVDPSRIRFVHEATTDKARAALFAACRDGSVNVLLGSTSKVGVGTNIQTRLRALHHVDAPWRPADVEQREGRALRPGNLNTDVDIYRYVTQGTFDAYMWQTLETKARFIHQLMRAVVTADTITDIGEQTLSFGEVKALAAGNPLLLDQAKVAVNVRQLRVLEAMHNQNVGALRSSARADRSRAGVLDRMHTGLGEAAAELATLNRDQTLSQRQSEAARAGNGAIEPASKPSWQSAESHAWGPVRLCVNEVLSTRKLVVFKVLYRYAEIGSVQVIRKALRHQPTETVMNAMEAFFASCAAHQNLLSGQAGELLERAQESERLADESVFAKADELRGATALLTSITAEIAETAVELAAA